MNQFNYLIMLCFMINYCVSDDSVHGHRGVRSFPGPVSGDRPQSVPLSVSDLLCLHVLHHSRRDEGRAVD